MIKKLKGAIHPDGKGIHLEFYMAQEVK